MTTATRARHSLQALACLLAFPGALAAGECGLRLSEVDAATTELTQEVEDLSRTLAVMFRDFAKLEARANDPQGGCPDALSTSLEDARTLDVDSLEARGDALLRCGQDYELRVQADIAAATRDNDSQMLLRLTEIQRRILAVQAQATENLVSATFLGLRADRLVKEHGTVLQRCAILGDAYD